MSGAQQRCGQTSVDDHFLASGILVFRTQRAGKPVTQKVDLRTLSDRPMRAGVGMLQASGKSNEASRAIWGLLLCNRIDH
jgi:hypothetical protein